MSVNKGRTTNDTTDEKRCPRCRVPYNEELYLGVMCRDCWIDSGRPKNLGELRYS